MQCAAVMDRGQGRFVAVLLVAVSLAGLGCRSLTAAPGEADLAAGFRREVLESAAVQSCLARYDRDDLKAEELNAELARRLGGWLLQGGAATEGVRARAGMDCRVHTVPALEPHSWTGAHRPAAGDCRVLERRLALGTHTVLLVLELARQELARQELARQELAREELTREPAPQVTLSADLPPAGRP